MQKNTEWNPYSQTSQINKVGVHERIKELLGEVLPGEPSLRLDKKQKIRMATLEPSLKKKCININTKLNNLQKKCLRLANKSEDTPLYELFFSLVHLDFDRDILTWLGLKVWKNAK